MPPYSMAAKKKMQKEGAEEPAEAAGYKILGHRFEFVGLCPACRETPVDQSGPLENHRHVVTMPNAQE